MFGWKGSKRKCRDENTLMIQAKEKKGKRGSGENFAKTIEKLRKNRRLG